MANDAWYHSIKREVSDRDVYRFKNWQPEDPDNVCIVDVGANVGAFSVKAAERFPNAKIYSFEMVRANYDYALTKLLKYENVVLFNRALIGSNKPVGMFQHKSNHGGHKPIFGENTESYLKSDAFKSEWTASEVPSMSLQQLIESQGIPKIDFLKLDCEGSEYEILFHVDDLGLWNRIEHIAMELHGRHEPEQMKRMEKMLNENFSNVEFGQMTHCSGKR